MIADLKKIDQFADRHGQQRYYVRLDGHRYVLPDPGDPKNPSSEFLACYWRAMAGEAQRRTKKLKLSPRNPVGTIYVAGYDRFLKIGFTNQSVAERIRTLSTGSPLALELFFTLPGRVADEQALHRRFAAYRLRGEWFDLRGDLLEWFLQMRPNSSNPSNPVESLEL